MPPPEEAEEQTAAGVVAQTPSRWSCFRSRRSTWSTSAASTSTSVPPERCELGYLAPHIYAFTVFSSRDTRALRQKYVISQTLKRKKHKQAFEA